MNRMMAAICAALALLAFVPAHAQTIYGSLRDGSIVTINADTGDVTPIGRTRFAISDIAFAPDGTLYGISSITLFKINPLTAATTVIGDFGVANMNALAVRSDGTLFAAGVNRVYTINPTTGAATALPSFLDEFGGPFRSSGDLEFDPAGNLYLTSNAFANDNDLVLVDQATGLGSFIGETTKAGIEGLAFTDGKLFGLANREQQVITIDPATGLASDPVFFTASTFFTGATAFPSAPSPVPEPGALAFVGGLVTCGGLLLRRRATRSRSRPRNR